MVMEEKTQSNKPIRSKSKKLVLYLIATLIVCSVVAIFIFREPKAGSPVDANSSIEITAIETKPPTETDVISDLIIETPYCNLFFPSKWNGQVYTTAKESAASYDVVFVGKLGDQDANLFSVVFGESEEMPIGVLTQPDGSKVTVRLNVDMFDSTGLSPEQIEVAQSIMESSTYLVEKISDLDNFH